jgi:hypothetical protein
MTGNQTDNWIRNHLRRQAFLVWLVTHHFLTEALAERADAADNAARLKNLARQNAERGTK